MQNCVRWGSLTSQRKERFGFDFQPERAVVNCSQTVSSMLPPGTEELVGLATAITPLAELL